MSRFGIASRLLPLSVRKRVAGAAVRVRTEAMGRRPRLTAPPPGSVILAGFTQEGFGIGRAGRYTRDGLRDAGATVASVDLRALLAGRAGLDALPPGGVLVVHANPPEALAALSRLPREAWRGRYLVGYWAYELERAPALWRRAVRVFDEVWVPSPFVAGALPPDERVRVMPHPVPAAPVAPPPPGFVVGAAGDLASSATRKNLDGNVAAYLRAFPRPAPGVRLVVKVREAAGQGAALADLRERTRGREDVALVTDRLDDARTDALWAGLSVFLSAHRAEGYGLVLAECLARGVPVLATGWSGNLAFMSEVPELLLPYDLVPMHDPAGIYHARGARWAEPDIGAAARALATMRADPAPAREAALAARATLARQREAWIDAARPLVVGAQSEAS